MAKISMNEVRKHNKPNDVWIVINKKVYDVTKYLKNHPGGAEVLINVAGKDATQAFEQIAHSKSARSSLNKYYIGDLE